MPPLSAPFRPEMSCAESSEHLAVDDNAGDIGDEDEPVGAERNREHGGSVVGIHIQRASRERRDHRDAAAARTPQRLGGTTGRSIPTWP